MKTRIFQACTNTNTNVGKNYFETMLIFNNCYLSVKCNKTDATISIK